MTSFLDILRCLCDIFQCKFEMEEKMRQEQLAKTDSRDRTARRRGVRKANKGITESKIKLKEAQIKLEKLLNP